LREGYIKSLSPEEADERFAPRVLKVVVTEPSRNREQEIHAVKQHIARNSPSDFPLLVWCLFDVESDDIELISSSFDLSVASKLRHLPGIIQGFRSLSMKVDDETSPNFEQPVSILLEHIRHDEAGEFEKAWEACRYGQRFECEAVEDLGPLSALQLKDLLVWQGDGSDGASRALVLLRNLVEAHNSHVQMLQGPQPYEDVTISLYQAPEQIAEYLVPWSRARNWLREIVLQLPQREPSQMAKEMESLLRMWLKQTLNLVKFSLDDWPQAQAVPAGIVRLGVMEQASALPQECIAAIDEFFRQHGLLRDKVCLALHILKKIALSIEASQNKISPETWLQDKIFGERLAPPSSLLEIFDPKKGKRLDVRLKHLNALQEHLCGRIEAKAEDVLGTAYRTPLDHAQLSHLKNSLSIFTPKHRFLLRKLSTLAEMLSRDAYAASHGLSTSFPPPKKFPSHTCCLPDRISLNRMLIFKAHARLLNPSISSLAAEMCEYLISIDIEGVSCEDDDYVEPVRQLKLEHTFHALFTVRKTLLEAAEKDAAEKAKAAVEG
jgi:hypothetical protein